MADQKARRRSKSKPVSVIPAVKPTYEVPKWAGKPPTGMHLDVTKDGKLIEKCMVDGKTHFFFGRQREFIDFTVDHSSCSRVHAVMVYHKHLQRMFLLDLGSTHGTFMGSIILEANAPKQLPIDEPFRFGASTRTWILREKPNAASNMDISLNGSVNESLNDHETSTVSLLGLPEAEAELHDLTEFNTAHNRRIATLPIDEAKHVNPLSRKRSRSSANVSFDTEESIINPEDVDPTIGRFRNLVSTEIIIPNKKPRTSSNSSDTGIQSTSAHIAKTQQDFHTNPLYSELEVSSPTVKTLAPRITSAPDVEEPDLYTGIRNVVNKNKVDDNVEIIERPIGTFEPIKKKYLKEAWPGRKPKGQNLLSV